MRYEEDKGGYLTHQLFLTTEEFDNFFDPYDPDDTELPSYMHRNRVRFIKEWAYEWLLTNVGESMKQWQVFGDLRMFIFKNKDKAMLFKLTHSLSGT